MTVRVLNTVDDDSDGRRTMDHETHRQKVEDVRRMERPGDGEVIGAARPVEGQYAGRRPGQRLVSVLSAAAEVDDELVHAVLHLDIPIATRTSAHWRH